MGVIKAKLEPKYAGIFARVMSMYNKLPIPEASSAADIGICVKNGTSTVEPNIANKCWVLKNAHWEGFGLSLTSSTGFAVRSNNCSFSISFSPFKKSLFTRCKETETKHPLSMKIHVALYMHKRTVQLIQRPHSS